MPFDGFLMKRTVERISDEIKDCNIRNIYLSKNILYFSFDDGDLKISLNPMFAHISLVNHLVSDPEKNAFVDLLRSRIRGARISEFVNMDYERTAILRLKKMDETGTKHNYEIYIDIMGKHSNAIFVEDGIILDAFRRVETRFRNINPGKEFAIFPSKKVRIEDVDSKECLERILKTFLEQSGDKKPKISEFLYSSLQGFSKITAEEVLFRADLEDSAVSEMDESMITSLWNALHTVRLELASNYSFIYYEDNEPVDISAIRLHAYSDEKRCDNVLACINEYFTFVEKKEKRLQKKNQLSSVVKAKIDVYETLLKKLNEEFDECKELDRYRKYGELIKAYAYQIQSGNEKVSLLDWETNEVVQVPLEKNLSPIENSVRYFNMYSKLKRKASGLKERIEIVSRELDYLQQLLMTIESAEDLEDLKEIEEEMVENELIKVRKSKGKLQTSREFVSQPRKYVYNGFTIYVGKNNRQNDELVRKASDNDLWFHVQGMPGAHVLIKTAGKYVDEDTLKYAASLAATYSKGKYSSNVPVDYTQIKYVKKPRGFKPGLVLYSNFKTIFADPIDHSAE